MKKTILLSALLAISNFIFAQSLTHSITAGAQTGRTLHGTAQGVGFNLQYDLELSNSISLSAATGFLSGTKEYTPDYSGVYNGEPYFGSPVYFSKEKHVNLDLTLLCRLTKSNSNYALRIGAGASIVLTNFEYPDQMIIVRGEIVENNYSTSRYNATIAHLVLENEYKISNHLSIHLRGIYRTTVEEEDFVLSEVIGTNARSEGNYSIQHNLAASLGVKYTF